MVSASDLEALKASWKTLHLFYNYLGLIIGVCVHFDFDWISKLICQERFSNLSSHNVLEVEKIICKAEKFRMFIAIFQNVKSRRRPRVTEVKVIVRSDAHLTARNSHIVHKSVKALEKYEFFDWQKFNEDVHRAVRGRQCLGRYFVLNRAGD